MRIEFNEDNEHLVDVFTGRSLEHQFNVEDLEDFIENEQLNYESQGETNYNWSGGYIENEGNWLVKSESASDYLESNLHKVVMLFIKYELKAA